MIMTNMDIEEKSGFVSPELQTEVYNAAKDGNLNRLRILVEPRPKDIARKLINSRTNGATPLIMSCRNGHMTIVEYLIDKYSADIEQVGSVTFDGENIEGAPPLWCAAAAGHISIVKALVKSGASVNNTTFTNSTPLRAACFDGHYDIVKYLVDHGHGADIEIANRHGHTCLMISCYKGHYKIAEYLLDKGANVNRHSVKGNTALHDSAESGSLNIMKLLLFRQAKMEKDSYGMTPLLAAAVTGHTTVVEYLIGRNQCTKAERINALELLGATFVDKKRDMMGALKYWKKAMQERNRHPNKIQKPVPKAPVDAYEGAVEARTIDELDDLISDPDDMRMQALLVRERILGPAHPDTSYYIRFRGAVYADMGNFDRCITLWMYALDMQQQILEPLSAMTQSSFLSFAELFSFMMGESRARKPYPVAFKDMMTVYVKAVDELEKSMKAISETTLNERDSTSFNRLLVIIMHLICLMSKNKETLSQEQLFDFKKITYRLVRLNPKGAKGYSILHLACCKETSNVGRYPVCCFPSVEVAKLLIEVGALVNAADTDLNTPLHIAAMNKPCKENIIKLLLDQGAHIDACNALKETPSGLMNNISLTEIVCPLEYMTLQCLAAKVIQTKSIEYKSQVSKKLAQFIEMH